jgi:hypothetical protein
MAVGPDYGTGLNTIARPAICSYLSGSWFLSLWTTAGAIGARSVCGGRLSYIGHQRCVIANIQVADEEIGLRVGISIRAA